MNIFRNILRSVLSLFGIRRRRKVTVIQNVLGMSTKDASRWQ